MTARAEIQARIARLRAEPGRRVLVALAGPPASGKSTLAAELAQALGAAGLAAAVVPMDGFHLDNRLLEQSHMLHRKGAPETFDANGLLRLLPALRDAPEVIFPLFDRRRDIAVAGAGRIDRSCTHVICEGNYLLLDEDPWRRMRPFWDLSVLLTAPRDRLRDRLVRRWTDHGLTAEAARDRAAANDLPNAERVLTRSALPDLTLETTE